VILKALQQGLSAQRIWQDLAAEHGFAGSYDSVKRFIRRLGSATPLPFRRIECPPGEEAQKARLVGPHTGRWAEQMILQRGIEGVRPLMGLLSLARRHPAGAIEQACETACRHGAYRLRTVRQLIQRQGDRQEWFAFLDEHPIIRSMAEYGRLVHTAFEEQTV